METIKPIQTEYNGYKFRSRLEARWAVFFDSLNIKYEYEPEGFTNGETKYLPDFYLPDDDVYVEVKAKREGYEEELMKAVEIVRENTNRLLILSNVPDGSEPFWWFPLVVYDNFTQKIVYKRVFFNYLDKGYIVTNFNSYGGRGWLYPNTAAFSGLLDLKRHTECDWWFIETDDYGNKFVAECVYDPSDEAAERLTQAYKNARSKRFEYDSD